MSDHAPPNHNWAYDRNTGSFVLHRMDDAMTELKGDYTSDHMMKELIAIARNEANAVPERLQAYQLVINTTELMMKLAGKVGC